MIDKDLHLRRRKDGKEVITLAAEGPPRLKGKAHVDWNTQIRAFVPVRYVKSGRKAYLKGDVLDADWIVIGKADPDSRWDRRPVVEGAESAAALEDLRERDIRAVKKRILETVYAPAPHNEPLGNLQPSPSALNALEQAIHMILAGS